MRRRSAFCLLGLTAAAAAAEPASAQSARNGCQACTWNMVREFNLLRMAPLSATTLTAPDPEARPIALDR